MKIKELMENRNRSDTIDVYVEPDELKGLRGVDPDVNEYKGKLYYEIDPGVSRGESERAFRSYQQGRGGNMEPPRKGEIENMQLDIILGGKEVEYDLDKNPKLKDRMEQEIADHLS